MLDILRGQVAKKISYLNSTSREYFLLFLTSIGKFVPKSSATESLLPTCMLQLTQNLILKPNKTLEFYTKHTYFKGKKTLNMRSIFKNRYSRTWC